MDRRSLLNDSEETHRLILDGRQASIWSALPCIITKINFAEMTLECQPAIQGTVTAEDDTSSFVNLPVLVDVPICFPSGGGFIITFPLAIGDEVLVIFASRCIDSWWQSGQISIPAEFRMHDLSDGFAIPGPKSLPNVVANISTSALQIRNTAGTGVIEIDSDGKVKITATEFDLTGDLKVTGNILATGEVTGNSGTAPIALTTHVHTSAAPGSPTSPPVP